MGGMLMKAHKSGNLEGAVDDMEATLGDSGQEAPRPTSPTRPQLEGVYDANADALALLPPISNSWEDGSTRRPGGGGHALLSGWDTATGGEQAASPAQPTPSVSAGVHDDSAARPGGGGHALLSGWDTATGGNPARPNLDGGSDTLTPMRNSWAGGSTRTAANAGTSGQPQSPEMTLAETFPESPDGDDGTATPDLQAGTAPDLAGAGSPRSGSVTVVIHGADSDTDSETEHAHDTFAEAGVAARPESPESPESPSKLKVRNN